MKRFCILLAILFALLSTLSACAPSPPEPSLAPSPEASPAVSPSPPPEEPPVTVTGAVRRNYYEIFVGSFYDSDGDGIGDLQGVIAKLDYLAELGIDGIWLMPISPSPSYHKYDVTDYYGIDPAYGTMEDFEELIAACGRLGIGVVIDLVINHSSTGHPWFLEACAALRGGTPSKYTEYYVFADNKVNMSYYQVYGTELWYEALFWSGMPDLNMDSADLRNEIAGIAAFWLDKGVEGFRLDAAKHIYNVHRDNYEFWAWFSDMCREIKEDVFLVAEVWDIDSVILPYFDTGLSSLFNFTFAGKDGTINDCVERADGITLAQNIFRMDRLIRSRNPVGIHSPFLSNHDTDRSAGYISSIEKQKLQAAIYLMIPGSPFIYYGEEIGMTGSGRDENKRLPMLWETVDEQLTDPDSLLNYYRAVLALKALFPDIQNGEVDEFIQFNSRAICAFRAGSAVIMHNLSGETVELEIPSGLAWDAVLEGYVSPTGQPVEIRNRIISIAPYATAVLS
jgi:glycosidase